MSIVIATLPRTGNGRALWNAASELLSGLFGYRTQKSVSTSTSTNELSFWRLYRLTVGYDCISPKVAAELRKQLAG